MMIVDVAVSLVPSRVPKMCLRKYELVDWKYELENLTSKAISCGLHAQKMKFYKNGN